MAGRPQLQGLQGPAHDVKYICGILAVSSVCVPERVSLQVEVFRREEGDGYYY